jgi:hypothetical protein
MPFGCPAYRRRAFGDRGDDVVQGNRDHDVLIGGAGSHLALGGLGGHDVCRAERIREKGCTG